MKIEEKYQKLLEFVKEMSKLYSCETGVIEARKLLQEIGEI